MFIFFTLLIALVPLSCSNQTPPAPPAPESGNPMPPSSESLEKNSEPLEKSPDTVSAPSLWMRPMGIIKSGAYPLWFELGPEREGRAGPFLIPRPEEASLSPFEPWPLARRITGMLFQEDRLVMTMNREGFLLGIPWQERDIALYPIRDSGYWDDYTVGALFLFEGKPAAMLYQNDFFADPQADPPEKQFFAPQKGSTRPVELIIPAFAPFLPAEGRKLDALREGRDGSWYYRGLQNLRGSRKLLYFRTEDLSLPGKPVSLGAFRNAALPRPLNQAPLVLAGTLEKVFALTGRDRTPMAFINSPQFPAPRAFAGNTGLSGEQDALVELSGYYLPQDAGGARALVILPDGRGIRGSDPGNGLAFEEITLPPLPEGFVYTGIGLVGTTLIASWEEQQDMNVGAAGLMILRLP